MTSKKKRHNETKMSGGLYRIILFNGGDETIFNDNMEYLLYKHVLMPARAENPISTSVRATMKRFRGMACVLLC